MPGTAIPPTPGRIGEKIPLGWIGLGSMGIPMASRLASAGFPLFVYNRTPKSPVGYGPLTLCQTPAEVASLSRILFVMVTDGIASSNIFRGKGGLLEADLRDTIVVNMTTESPEEAVREAEEVGKAGGTYFDIPVSGSVVPAQKGELLLLAGGDSSLEPFLKPALSVLGSGIKWMGPVGSGMKTKLVLNALLAAHMRDLAESILLAEFLGLSRREMSEVILDSPLATPFYRIKVRNILEENFKKAFSVALMAKDLTLLSLECRERGKELPSLFSDLEKIYRTMNAAGNGEKDLSVIYAQLKGERQKSSGGPASG
jgi:3-hydroxyisobutyrate dehydrogenase